MIAFSQKVMYSINMITVSKGIFHVILHISGDIIYLLDTPTHEQEVGQKSHRLRMLGRIVEMRSTKQSVIKVLTPKS